MRRGFAVMMVATVVAGTALAQSGGTSLSPAWTVPEREVAKKNPFASKPEMTAGGKKLYARNCATCHGDETHGQTNRAPSLATAEVQQQSDGALFWRISNGNSKTGMPSFSGLPEPQRWQLVMYIRSLRK